MNQKSCFFFITIVASFYSIGHFGQNEFMDQPKICLIGSNFLKMGQMSKVSALKVIFGPVQNYLSISVLEL